MHFSLSLNNYTHNLSPSSIHTDLSSSYSSSSPYTDILDLLQKILAVGIHGVRCQCVIPQIQQEKLRSNWSSMSASVIHRESRFGDDTGCRLPTRKIHFSDGTGCSSSMMGKLLWRRRVYAQQVCRLYRGEITPAMAQVAGCP
uniref:Uncharacterized protein n=1 Tax=Leersia perrieri TaxID=77586 RepID=A0A0D9VYS4_9ORYZ